MSDLSEHKYNCPKCRKELWKWQARTGMYCHACGTKVRETIFDEKYQWDQKTFEAFFFGFMKGFLVAGFFGFWFGYGLYTGLLWGSIWGIYRYFTGTPNSLYGEKYLTFY